MTVLRDIGVVAALWTAASLVTAGAWWAIAHFFKTRTTKTPGGSR